ncbi:hypothetical protein HQ531_07740 [bacterium]|nr:hypothetical protein [bacterium]
MSRKISLLAILMMALMVMFTVSCEGPAGADGAEGAVGAVGPEGPAATLACLDCHSAANMDGIEEMYALSQHSIGATTAYAGGRADCSRCHSSEGFRNFLAATPGVDPSDIDYQTVISCATCHANHRSLEDDLDVPLRTVAPIVGIADGTIYDFEGPSNLCGTCHQSRRAYTYYEEIDSVWTDDVNGDDSLDFVVPEGSVYINSSHAGPHHGPQVNTLFGDGGYGTSSVGTHASAGCTTCHMGEAGLTEGGHSFWPNVDNCMECHTTVTDMAAFLEEKQAAFNTRLGAIAEALVVAGALSGDATEGYHPHVAVVTEDVFKAFYNYMVMYEDHSHGVHNPGYFNTLLTGAELWLGLP